MSKNVIEISEATFETEVRASDIPVVVDFWASWCGPCKMIAPLFAEVAEAYEGKVKFAKVNVDDNSAIAGQFKVMSIPTLLFFKGGHEYSKSVGAISKNDLVKKVEELLV